MELVVSIVVIGIAVAGVFALFYQTAGRSADPVLREQAVAIAEAYLEEITLKAFLDPDTGTDCPPPEASRSNFDNVCDYNGLTDVGARNPINPGVPVAGLEQYIVNVSVVSEGLNGIPSGQSKRIDVRVTHSGTSLVDVLLSGYRTRY
ncbi:MAG: hypothetical protein Kow006_13640 [Gammaproteobacteria bacterium]